MKIGNIISNQELVNHEKLNFVNYLTYDEYVKSDKKLPTLFVGKKTLDHYSKNKYSIAEKEIKYNHIYWEFSFDERKEDHINGINEFINNLPDLYFKKRYSYIDLNPVFFNLSDIEELFCVVPQKIQKVFKTNTNMLYLLKDNKITGIDLNTYSFFNFNIEDIENKIKNITDIFINDSTGDILLKNNQKFLGYEDICRYIVTLE
jgi:hypothetical protein